MGRQRQGGRNAGAPFVKQCANCNSTIIVGGRRQGSLWFCGPTCAAQGHRLAIAETVSEGVALTKAAQIHAGTCPICGRSGPVDVHASYRTWSALLLTSSWTNVQVSCRRCGIKAQLRGAMLSLACGWWGAHGVLMTPVQIARNAHSMLNPPDPALPSALLVQRVKLDTADDLLAQRRGGAQCPTCGSAYELADYLPDAEHIYCSFCRSELPRGTVPSTAPSIETGRPSL